MFWHAKESRMPPVRSRLEQSVFQIRNWIVRMRATRSISHVSIAVSQAIEQSREVLEIMYSMDEFRDSVHKALTWLIEELYHVTPSPQTDTHKRRLFAFVQSYLLPVVRGEEPQMRLSVVCTDS